MSTTINYSIFTKSSLIVFVSCPVLKLQVFDTDLLAVSFPTLSNALNACQVQDACSNSSSSFGVFPTSAQYWARKRRWISIFKHPWCNKYESECLLKEELELIGPVTKTTPFQHLRQIPTHWEAPLEFPLHTGSRSVETGSDFQPPVVYSGSPSVSTAPSQLRFAPSPRHAVQRQTWLHSY